ncbi:uncharacterized protein [Mytilus edulis]|uniref:uncharacterized protein n=1 Tax=Mytilus edulis TaxID=6550 RepID=UPI0039F14020
MDGPSMLYSTIKTYCGGSIPGLVTLSGDSATIYFYTTSDDNNYRGFKMEYWAEEDVDEFGPIHYSTVNYVLMVVSAVVLLVVLICFIYLIIRECRKKPTAYTPNFHQYSKPPRRKRYSFVYEKYFVNPDQKNFKPFEKLKLPPITESVFSTHNEIQNMKNRMRGEL